MSKVYFLLLLWDGNQPGDYYYILKQWQRNNSYIPFCLLDIDECAAPVNPCDNATNSTCNNTNGSYICQCKDGFVKNGPNCEGVINF